MLAKKRFIFLPLMSLVFLFLFSVLYTGTEVWGGELPSLEQYFDLPGDINTTYIGGVYAVSIWPKDTAPEDLNYHTKFGYSSSDINLEYSPEINSIGEHTVYYKISADGYADYVGSVKITLRAKSLIVTAKDQTIAYNGNIDKSESSYTLSTNDAPAHDNVLLILIEGHTANVTLTVNESDEIVPSVKVTSNIDGQEKDETAYYDITLIPGKLTINKGTPVLSGLKATSITYGQTLADSTVTGTAELDGKSIEGTFSFKDTSIKPQVSDSEKTEYTVVFTPANTKYYNAVEGKVKLTVSPKSIAGAVVSLDSSGLIYNGKVRTVPVKSVTLSDKTVLSENDYDISGNTATNAGTYTVTITGKNNYTDTATASFTIAKKAFKVFVLDQKIEKTGNSAPDIENGSDYYIISGLGSEPAAADGETIDVTLRADENCIIYATVKVTGTDNTDTTKNYSIEILTGTVTYITPSTPLKPDISEITATKIIYGQKLSESNISGKAVVGNQTVEGTFLFTYPYTKPSVSDSEKTEYSVIFEPSDVKKYASVTGKVKLKVVPRTINGATIELSSTSLTYTGSKQTVSVNSVTLENDTVLKPGDYKVTGNTAKDAGEYTVNVTGQGNYAGSADAFFKINKASLKNTISVSSYNSVYDGVGHSITITGVPESATVSYRYGNSNTRDYSIASNPSYVQAGFNEVFFKIISKNYEDYEGSGTVTISKRVFTVTAKDQEIPEGSQISTDDTQYTISPAEYNPAADNETISVTLKVNDNNKIVPEVKVYRGSAESTSNYDITVSEGTLTYTEPKPEPKPEPEKPKAPKCKTKNAGSITLVPVEGCEYSMDGKQWQASPVFNKLEQDTEYTFYQRFKATADKQASEISDATKIKTDEHKHEWVLKAQGNKITATCKNSDEGHGKTKNETLTLKANNKKYTGKALVIATILGNIDGLKIPKIVYYKGKKEVSKPKKIGTYTAKITLKGSNGKEVTASVKCQITGKKTSVKEAQIIKLQINDFTILSSELFKKAQSITLKATNNKGKCTYKLISSGKIKVKITNKGIITINRQRLKIGTYQIRVKVTAAGTDQYEETTETFTITISVK